MFQKIEMVKYRKIAEGFFNLKCSIFEYKKFKDGCVSKRELVAVKENVPCRRSYGTGFNTENSRIGDTVKDNVEVKQTIRLFLPYDVHINAGSFVRIDKGDTSMYYEYSGHCYVYDTHIEVLLRNTKRWA